MLACVAAKLAVPGNCIAILVTAGFPGLNTAAEMLCKLGIRCDASACHGSLCNRPQSSGSG